MTGKLLASQYIADPAAVLTQVEEAAWKSALAGQHGCGSRLAGQAVPGSGALAVGGAEVAVDLAGDVTLQAADDLFLRQALFTAPLDVGPRRGVGAHPGDHDPPQGMVGLAVAAGVEPVAGDFPR